MASGGRDSLWPLRPDALDLNLTEMNRGGMVLQADESVIALQARHAWIFFRQIGKAATDDVLFVHPYVTFRADAADTD